MELDGVSVQVGASLGVAAAPDAATTIDDLLHRADLAMYAAKSTRGGVRWFSATGDDATTPGMPAGSGDLLFRPGWPGTGASSPPWLTSLVRTAASRWLRT